MPPSNDSVVQREKEFHNQLAQGMDIASLLVRESFESPTAVENRFALESMGPIQGKKILDLGCGAGEAAVYFALQGAQVEGCDVAEELLVLAKQLALNYGVAPQFSVASSSALPYPDGHFDFVFGNGVLHHVDLPATAREVRRVLKPGGKAFFIEPLPYNPVIHIYRAMASKVRSADECPLSFKQLSDFASFFFSSRHREFWLFSLGIFLHFFFIRRWHPSKVRYWKKVIEAGEEYRGLFQKLQRMDDLCLKYVPFSNYLCWNTVLQVQK
ncbi:MAG TPA: class I SAM-dependent methyltransferase [Candidatus Omnitrophota bacterium]|nr:class I SAM-dependent methyltransferase [Candidatus Omnitrophota bacterium]